jgi:hypothetical protein
MFLEFELFVFKKAKRNKKSGLQKGTILTKNPLRLGQTRRNHARRFNRAVFIVHAEAIDVLKPSMEKACSGKRARDESGAWIEVDLKSTVFSLEHLKLTRAFCPELVSLNGSIRKRVQFMRQARP